MKSGLWWVWMIQNSALIFKSFKLRFFFACHRFLLFFCFWIFLTCDVVLKWEWENTRRSFGFWNRSTTSHYEHSQQHIVSAASCRRPFVTDRHYAGFPIVDTFFFSSTTTTCGANKTDTTFQQQQQQQQATTTTTSICEYTAAAILCNNAGCRRRRTCLALTLFFAALVSASTWFPSEISIRDFLQQNVQCYYSCYFCL